jgi:hypothetical protein
LLGAPQAKNFLNLFSAWRCNTGLQYGIALRRYRKALRHGKWCSTQHHSPPLLGAPQAMFFFHCFLRYGGTALRYGVAVAVLLALLDAHITNRITYCIPGCISVRNTARITIRNTVLHSWLH